MDRLQLWIYAVLARIQECCDMRVFCAIFWWFFYAFSMSKYTYEEIVSQWKISHNLFDHIEWVPLLTIWKGVLDKCCPTSADECFSFWEI